MNKNIFNTLILIFATVFFVTQTQLILLWMTVMEQHNLYSELDDGNVVVLCWVMPCGPCALG